MYKQDYKGGKKHVNIYITCGITAVIILFCDLLLPLGVAGGVPYILVILLSLRCPQNKCTITLAIISSILTLIGFAASPPGGELWKVILNRLIALFAIWITTILALSQRKSTNELAEEKLKMLNAIQEHELQEERLRILRATMRTVQDIVGNFLNNLQIFQLEVEEENTLKPESIKLMNTLILDTSERLNTLGNLETVQEKEMAGGKVGIDYEMSD